MDLLSRWPSELDFLEHQAFSRKYKLSPLQQESTPTNLRHRTHFYFDPSLNILTGAGGDRISLEPFSPASPGRKMGLRGNGLR